MKAKRLVHEQRLDGARVLIAACGKQMRAKTNGALANHVRGEKLVLVGDGVRFANARLGLFPIGAHIWESLDHGVEVRRLEALLV